MCYLYSPKKSTFKVWDGCVLVDSSCDDRGSRSCSWHGQVCCSLKSPNLKWSYHRYPPLPDIILDNVPHIPWAFEMTELTGMTLLLIWFIMIICHKHRLVDGCCNNGALLTKESRWIIARRFFAIAGTIFLLRCVTMLITRWLRYSIQST